MARFVFEGVKEFQEEEQPCTRRLERVGDRWMLVLSAGRFLIFYPKIQSTS